MTDNHFRQALRSLARQKGYASINILGLALGLCACLVIYTIVSYEFSFDRSVPDRDRVYRIGSRLQEDNGNGALTVGYGESIPAAASQSIRAELPFVETLACYYPYNVDISNPQRRQGEFSRVSASSILVSKDYFDIFPYTWLVGNPAQSLDRPIASCSPKDRQAIILGRCPSLNI